MKNSTVKEYYFIYTNAPQAPTMVIAIYPIETDLTLLKNKYSSYHEIRKASWDFGNFPRYDLTISV